MNVVLQKSILFSGKIQENICQCRPSADMEVENFARLAKAHGVIMDLAQRYEPHVAEKAVCFLLVNAKALRWQEN
ncbi:hypothetical protein [Candidatus Williamhamiltonella defendens]|uniref:hypothetical protein n=1 Tax=Candidatus Williamhamiltonella defendens TaxID=138072 RepID=UPI00387E7482